MKNLTSLVFLISVSLSVFSQNNEFKIHENGLMYSDTTMAQLQQIVDSLNYQFQTCDLSKTYYSNYQARADYIRLDSGNVDQAIDDLSNGISLDLFLENYPTAKVERDLLVVRFQYTNYEDKEVVKLESYPMKRSISLDANSENLNTELKGNWKWTSWEGYSDGSKHLSAFYFTSNFNRELLPEKYARMVQYSYCLIDTNTQKHTENAKRSIERFTRDDSTKVGHFMNYIAEKTNKPEVDYENLSEYRKEYRKWDSTRYSILDELSTQSEFQNLMKAAINDALESGHSNDEFEGYVKKYHSKEMALLLKRSRIVVGQCSQDRSPRVHALNIAVLSAEAVNWEVFLRSHLDIMNDRFERITDGSYAYADRNTYIKELEELEINVADLLLGITFRISNPAKNHYYGSTNRIGRALADSNHSVEFRKKMIELLADEELDDFNRLVIYYLFHSFNYHTKEESLKNENIRLLKNSVEKLPDYLKNRITEFGN